MAKKKQEEEEVIVDVAETIGKAEKYIEENRKSITAIVGGVVVIVLGYFAYTNLYLEPREKEAQEEIFFAQQYFEQDSLRLALEGNASFSGFLEIADRFSGTKAANLCNYYIGVSYLNMGEFAEAIKYLDEFESNDPILGVIATGSIGDAFLEIGQPEDALDYYERAVSGQENNYVVPFYLLKAGMVAENLDKLEKANKYFTRIKKEFKDSREAESVDKYIARVEAQMNS